MSRPPPTPPAPFAAPHSSSSMVAAPVVPVVHYDCDLALCVVPPLALVAVGSLHERFPAAYARIANQQPLRLQKEGSCRPFLLLLFGHVPRYSFHSHLSQRSSRSAPPTALPICHF